MDYRSKPIFFIDSSTLRGASGSPVFVPVRPYTVDKKRETGQYILNPLKGYLPRLLGIVSATIPDWKLTIERVESFNQPPSKFEVVETANIGIVFRAETITQTIDQTGIMPWTEDNDNKE